MVHSKTKGGHGPDLAARQNFQPLFDNLEVDFMLYGHNHDFQVWLPMVSNASQKFSKLSDGTFDFSKPHGQFHITNGAGGHEHNKFKEEWKDNQKLTICER